MKLFQKQNTNVSLTKTDSNCNNLMKVLLEILSKNDVGGVFA